MRPGVEFWKFWVPGLGTRGALWLRHVAGALGFVCACDDDLGRGHMAQVGHLFAELVYPLFSLVRLIKKDKKKG